MPYYDCTLDDYLLQNHLSKNDIVIYESTVYPGCTEEECVPVLEFNSKMIFKVTLPSCDPLGPIQPGSFPPCPASKQTTLSEFLGGFFSESAVGNTADTNNRAKQKIKISRTVENIIF